MIRFGVERGAKSAGKSLASIAELIEVLCTSQSQALVNMREAYSRLYQVRLNPNPITLTLILTL